MADTPQPPRDRLDRIEAALERLEERHEALTETAELLTRDVQQDSQNIRALAGIARDALESIKRLETIAIAHEKRIDDLEK
jgi:archaellum component FlaC